MQKDQLEIPVDHQVELDPRMGATPEDAADFWLKNKSTKGRCSAFVKMLGEGKDLYIGHTTWDDYSKMTRLFKYYNFHLGG